MKKFLALVLALVMTMSLVTISAGATEYTDAESVSYDEAVAVVSGLGIVNGYGDGSFKPGVALNRGQAAKIICNMILGPTTAAALSCETAPFSDVPADHQFAGFISFCVNEGIIDGRADGTFGPTDTLSGHAFLKMVLGALGYDGAVEGFVGTNWAINVMKLAAKLELTDGNDVFVGSKTVTREEACLYAFNALVNTNTVTYGGGSSIVVSGGTTTVNLNEEGKAGSTGTTLYASVFNGQIAEGVVVANGANTAGQAYTSVAPVSDLTTSTNYNIDTDADLYGKFVNVYYKDTYTNKYKTGTTYAVVDKTVEVAVDKDDTAKELKDALSGEGFVVTSNVSFATKFQNGGKTSTAKTVVPGTTSGAGTGNMTAYGWYDETNKVTVPYGYAVADTYTLDKVTAVGTLAGKETITLASGSKQNNATTDVINEYEGIAKDDVVLVYQYGDVYNVYKAETITGKPTQVSTKAGSESITVDGAKYDVVVLNSYTNSGLTNVALGSIDYANEYVLYFDRSGDVCAITGVAAATDLVYAVATYSTTETGDYGAAAPKYWLQGVNTAGEEVIYQVYYNSGYVTAKGGSTAISAGTLYKVSTAYDSADGYKCTMATLSTLDGSDNVKKIGVYNSTAIDKDAVKIANNHYYASDVKFIYVEDSKEDMVVTVMDGVQAIPGSVAHSYYATKAATATNWNVECVFVTSAAPIVTSSIAFANEAANSTTTRAYTKADGSAATAFVHTVYVDGVETEILMESATALTGFKKISTDAQGISTAVNYTNTSAATGNTGKTVSALYNGLLSDGTVEDMVITDAKIVDLTDNNVDSAAALAALVDCGGTVKVAYVYDTNDVAASIVYVTDATFVASAAKDGANMVATIAANTFGTGNVKIAVDGVAYKWTTSATAAGTYTTVADATTASVAGVADQYYKVTITVTTTDGYVFEATSAAAQFA